MQAFAELILCLEELKRGNPDPAVVAIDGRSGAGKSTLADRLAVEMRGVVVRADDFFQGGSDSDWVQRTASEKVATVFDWARMRAEALEPLLKGRPATWHPFNFAAGVGLASEVIYRAPADLIVLDGVYSARPEFADLVDLAVLVEVPDEERRRRLIKREGEYFMKNWHRIWDEAEDYYFGVIRPRDTFDLVIAG